MSDPAKEREVVRGIHEGELGMHLHTNLRKFCDSRPTSLAYNLVHLDSCNEAWYGYLDAVWAKLKESDKPACEILKECAHDEDGSLQWGDSARNALRIAFDCFDDGDWVGMAAYIDPKDCEVDEPFPAEDTEE